MINPEITYQDGEQECREGCLSVPGYIGIVIRSYPYIIYLTDDRIHDRLHLPQILQILLHSTHRQGPDRRGNRGKIQISPIKEVALEHGLKISQPLRIRKDEDFMLMLEDLEPEMIVVKSLVHLHQSNSGI